jgi:methylenetetrahydrofolate reductase (NADPH)
MEGQSGVMVYPNVVLTTQKQEEAFSIWTEWSMFYRPGSAERSILEDVRDNRWLVSVVHHDYKNSEALWTFLLDDQQST